MTAEKGAPGEMEKGAKAVTVMAAAEVTVRVAAEVTVTAARGAGEEKERVAMEAMEEGEGKGTRPQALWCRPCPQPKKQCCWEWCHT